VDADEAATAGPVNRTPQVAISISWKNAPAGCYTSVVTRVAASGITWDGATPPNSSCP
jgi:hypothetical protein